MKRVISLLKKEKMALQKQISDDIKFYTIYYGGKIPKCKIRRIHRDRKFVKELDETIKILNEETFRERPKERT
jgi:hypothetical protein